MKKETIEILVEGGKATGGPPLGPKIGPMGLNINEVVGAINEKTSGFQGMKIPVKVIIDAATKQYEIEIGTPPTSALVRKELNTEGETTSVDIGFDKLLKVAEMKKSALLANDLKGAVKEVIGTCRSMSVTIDGKSAKEITEEINSGAYDEQIQQK